MNECIVILHPTNAAASLQIDFDSIAGSVLAWDEWILWNPSILERKWAVKPINLKKIKYINLLLFVTLQCFITFRGPGASPIWCHSVFRKVSVFRLQNV